MDLYQTLGVERYAIQARIKAAYRRLVKKWHPDLNKSPEAAERFRAIQHAYDVLSDPERRRRYDAGEDFEPKPTVDPIDVRAMGVIAQTVQGVLEGYDTQLPAHVDFIAKVVGEITEMVNMINGSLKGAQALEARAYKIEMIINRLKRKDPDKEDRAVVPPLRAEINKLRSMAKAETDDLIDRRSVMEAALKLIADEGYVYEWDKETKPASYNTAGYFNEVFAKAAKYGT